MIPKTCITCEHINFDTGDRGYSEDTPGTCWSSECRKGRWSMYGEEVYTDEYRDNLARAERCDLYQLASYYEKKP